MARCRLANLDDEEHKRVQRTSSRDKASDCLQETRKSQGEEPWLPHYFLDLGTDFLICAGEVLSQAREILLSPGSKQGFHDQVTEQLPEPRKRQELGQQKEYGTTRTMPELLGYSFQV